MKPFSAKMSSILKGKESAPASTKPIEENPDYQHPPLAPMTFIALENLHCPVMISTQGITCRIEVSPDTGEYQVKTTSNGRALSDEGIPPRDRKKKAVSDFMFKGLIGIHLHPAGVVLTLDQEKNFRDQARHNQPNAEILSLSPPGNIQEIRHERFFSVDLAQCTVDQPLMVSINKEKMHLQIRPLDEDRDDVWGLFISSPKGQIREDSQAVMMLKKGSAELIDRAFLTRLAASSVGGIDARTWNKEVIDPILMRLMVNDHSMLTIEEMFTVNGLTILSGSETVTHVGNYRAEKPEAAETHRRECEHTLLGIRDATLEGLMERGREMALGKDRKHAIAEAAKAIRKGSRDGVAILALELAVKEVLAPIYAGPGGSETAMIVNRETVSLLNAITSDLSGWVEADSIRATAVAAIERAVGSIASSLPMEGLDKMMLLELPEVPTKAREVQSVTLDELVVQVKRALSSPMFVRDIKTLAKNLSATEIKQEQQILARELDATIRGTIHTILQKILVRLAVKCHLFAIEKNKRQALNFDPSMVSDQPLTDRELEIILNRYEAYSQYMDSAFEARIASSLSGVIKDFQLGISDSQHHSLSTKSFLTYLIALRTTGGKVNEKSDSTPAASSLQGIPDALPDIQVSQPDPAVAKGLVRMVHREGKLLEVEFELAPRSGLVPEGVPNGLWFGFRDLAERIMGFYLTGETAQKKDRNKQTAAVNAFTRVLLQKTLNIFRNLKRLSASEGFSDAVTVMGEAMGTLSMRPGENPEDEFLDFRKRPSHVTEPPINLRHELRSLLLAMEKAGELDKDSFRFRQRVRSFALMGGTKGEEKVLLPLHIQAKRGLVTLQARFNEDKFNKSIRLIEVEGESEDEESVTQMGEETTRPLFTREEKIRQVEIRREETKKLSRSGIYKIVNSMPFFERFSEYEKTRIAEQDLSFKLFHKDDAVIQEGTRDTAYFILIKGFVRVVKGEVTIVRLGPGEMFGEIAFLTNTPRSMSIIADENILVLRMDQEMISHLDQESREKFKDHIIAKQVARLAETTVRVGGLASNTQKAAVVSKAPSSDEGVIKDMDRDEAVAIIDKLPFFSPFSAYEKRRVTAFNTSFRTYRSQGEIIRDGSQDTAFFIIIQGTVQVYKGSTLIAELGPGEFFGEMAFLSGSPRTSSVVSKGEVLTLKVDQGLLQRLGPEIREKIKDKFMEKLSERLLATTNLIANDK